VTLTAEQEDFVVKRLVRNGNLTTKIIYEMLKESRGFERVRRINRQIKYIEEKDIELYLADMCRKGFVVKLGSNGRGEVWSATGALMLKHNKAKAFLS
jgi:predicted DNA-binding transcriptional regulator